jgi:hypothetical protein
MDYAAAALPVAPRIGEAHGKALAAFARPGAWWDAADRLRIVAETRRAADCSLCEAKAQALSPNAVQGECRGDAELPPVAVAAIHGIRNDSGRLTRRWFDDLIDMGLQAEAYVELVALTASSVIVDTFAQGVGLEPPPLPEAQGGAPSFERSADVADAGAWLPLAAEGRANILRSLGLVPSALELFFGTFGTSYYMRPDAEFAIGRRQVELVASRVSAVNECFY